jgi:hypothetical protein
VTVWLDSYHNPHRRQLLVDGVDIPVFGVIVEVKPPNRYAFLGDIGVGERIAHRFVHSLWSAFDLL